MKDESYSEVIEGCSIDPIIGITSRGIVIRWNAAAAELYGYRAKEIHGKPASRLFPRDRQPGLRKVLDRMRRGEPTRRYETVSVRRDGGRVPVLVNVFPIAGRRGGEVCGVVIVRDITRRIRGREALLRQNRELLTFHRLSQIVLSERTLEASYSAIVREICSATGFPMAAIALHDEGKGTVVFHGLKGLSNRTDRSPLEYPIDKTLSGIVIRSGKPIIEAHVPDQPAYPSKLLQRLRAQTFVGIPMQLGKKTIGCLNLLHTESVAVSEEMARWFEGLANYIVVLTERKRSEEELTSSREQLRELSRRTRSAIEEERKRIAREIHDELGQELSLLQLELGLVQERLPPGEKDLRTKTRSMTRLIDSAIRSVQKISSDLRPTLLDNLGLGAAAEWAVAEFQKRTGIRCRVSVEPRDVTLDPERSTAFFRILQEALTNVLRHARATRVGVWLTKHDCEVELRIRDNGIGIAPRRIQDPKSTGLAGMRERVLPWDGSVSITGKPGKGTEVIVTVPLES